MGRQGPPLDSAWASVYQGPRRLQNPKRKRHPAGLPRLTVEEFEQSSCCLLVQGRRGAPPPSRKQCVFRHQGRCSCRAGRCRPNAVCVHGQPCDARTDSDGVCRLCDRNNCRRHSKAQRLNKVSLPMVLQPTWQPSRWSSSSVGWTWGPARPDPRLYLCDHGCGYEGLYHIVAVHRRVRLSQRTSKVVRKTHHARARARDNKGHGSMTHLHDCDDHI